MGHFYLNGKKYQITDTPGLLSRADEVRNDMELLTLSVLEHLPTMVVFVADLTEDCGMSVKDQWLIRQELKQKFGYKLWMDVLSKADLLEATFQEADKLLGGDDVGYYQNDDVQQIENAVEFAARLKNAQRMSSITQDGVSLLQEQVMQLTKTEDMVKLFNAHLAQIEIDLNDQDEEEVIFNNRIKA
eukprot:TRINITY_DN12770_c1_g1_i1.p1 TRINITY_DN12770_c1_g1~~TRINITY_DN12770_c1_g1_i1.p1  ORF type:complete len:187 (+),score=35.82 TRINITY_DN12770_c1_g1_i1:48-608(+)